MKKEIVNKIVNDLIIDRIIKMVEETTNDEFIERICNEIEKQTGEVIEDDSEVKDIIGDVMIPLYRDLSLFIVEKTLTK